MNTQESYQERYKRAKDRVEEIRSFYTHCFIYVIVNAGIASLNYWVDGWAFPWFLFAAGGWAIGLCAHGLAIFGSNPFTGKKWEERKIQELMEKEQINS